MGSEGLDRGGVYTKLMELVGETVELGIRGVDRQPPMLAYTEGELSSHGDSYMTDELRGGRRLGSRCAPDRRGIARLDPASRPLRRRDLMRRNLVDRYVLMYHPIVRGSGRRLFPEGSPLASLRLVDSVTTTTGVVIATYEPTEARP